MAKAKFTKPTQAELDNVLVKICNRKRLPDFTQVEGRNAKAEIHAYISSALGCGLDTARTYCGSPEKMKLAVWILLNAMANNDISEWLPVDANYAKPVLREFLGLDAFKIGKKFAMKDKALEVMFETSYRKIEIPPLTNMDRKQFADSVAINYTVFCRNLFDNKISLQNGKLLMLVLGFGIDEIGL